MADTTCPECGQTVTVLDGEIAQHQRPESREKCPGSGETPQSS